MSRSRGHRPGLWEGSSGLLFMPGPGPGQVGPRPGGTRREVRGHQWGGPLGPLSGHNVLDCFTTWPADREQWLAEGTGSRPTRGESSLA